MAIQEMLTEALKSEEEKFHEEQSNSAATLIQSIMRGVQTRLEAKQAKAGEDGGEEDSEVDGEGETVNQADDAGKETAQENAANAVQN